MRFHDLVATSRRVAATPARLGKIEHLASCLRAMTLDEVEIGVSYLGGSVRQRRVGLGPAAVQSASTGAAAEPTLDVRDVDEAFARIAELRGPGSTSERQRTLGALFACATAEEQEFLGRLVIGELRQGALEGVLAEAIARAAGVSATAVRRALMLAGDPGVVARAALAEGDAGLARFGLELFRPLQPMLAETAEDAAEAMTRLGRAALEYKIDGARVQVHRDGDDVRVFTRRLNDVTAAVPEIVAAVRTLPIRRIVLDGEVVALRSDGRPEPFQVTMRRFGRKLDVEALRAELPLTPFFFDLMSLDGDDLFDAPARAGHPCHGRADRLAPVSRAGPLV